MHKQIVDMIGIVLYYFRDPAEKVKYQAITTIYNFLNYYCTFLHHNQSRTVYLCTQQYSTYSLIW